MVLSALQSASYAEELGQPANRIVLSCKVSSVQDTILVHQDLASRCDYALHLGLTEAGMGSKGIVATAASTRQSITARDRRHHTRITHTAPGAPRTNEVIVCQELLQTMGRASIYAISECMPWLWQNELALSSEP